MGDRGYGSRRSYEGGREERSGYQDRRGGYERRGGRSRGGRFRGGYDDGEEARPEEHPNFQANWDHRVQEFDHMDLKPELLHGVYSYGFKSPSDIQALAIMPIKEGRSMIAQAQSGTGKTGAFSIGILDGIELGSDSTQALVLAPTRELAEQIYCFFAAIGERMAGLKVMIFRGGGSVAEEMRRAAAHPHIAIATPGRALHLIQSGYLRLEYLKTVCLDEADKLLKDDFVTQVQEIFSYFNEELQILLFSATFSLSVFNLVDRFIRDPVRILVKTDKLTLEGIRQFYVNTQNRDMKFDTLLDIYGNLSINRAIIFANSKSTVDDLQQRFEASGFTISPIHGGFDQSQRDQTMRDFRLGKTRVLVATDLLSRGIDVQQITLVINFELPKEQEVYMHRIGRSARYGRKGVAINLIDSSEMSLLSNLQKFYGTQIEELPDNFSEIVQEANESSEQSEADGRDVKPKA
jgi:translation initiation factor 4A